MPYLIDGHNLIPKLGMRLDSPDDEMELVSILQEFCRLGRRTVEVFFDGAPPGQARGNKIGSLTAHFVRQGTTADSAIASRLRKLGRAARNWTVVSSDRQVQAAASRAQAAVLSSEEFAGQLKQIQAAASGSSGEHKLSSKEVEEWLKLFNQRE